MLRFIFGPHGSGKSTELLRRIRQTAKDRRIMLVVPEQFSFQTERECSRLLGAELGNRVEVVSFTRLARLIFRTYGGLTGSYADKIAKNIMMNLALGEVQDGLEHYGKSVEKSGFAELMLKTADELKNSAISPESFESAVALFPEGNLRDKSREISLIYTTYDGLLNKTFRDPLDDLSRAVEKVRGTGFFEDYDIYFDEFLSFTAVQRGMIEEMMQAADLTFALCWDREDGGLLFEPCRKTTRSLLSMARRLGVGAERPVHLTENKLFVHPELAHLERNILRNRIEPYRGDCEHVKVLLAPNEYGEVDAVLSEVWELVQRHGYRFREIALITRDLESYQGVLESALRKYAIPYFMDETVSVEHDPLIRFASSLLAAADGGKDVSPVLALLKCGLTRFDLTQISYFENYLYTWNITKDQLAQPFTHNPRGFVDRETEQDSQVTALADEVRAAVAEVLSLLRGAEQTARGYGSALFEALHRLGAAEVINQRVERLNGEEKFPEAEEQARLWDVLIDILEVLAHSTGEVRLTLRRYRELFDLSAKGYDLGSIPQSLDAVMIGSAERTITGSPRAVFVFGAGEGIFPLSPQFDGVFTDSDREELKKLGIELSKPIGDRILEERFSAYKSLSSPREHLVVSARLADIAGSPLYPSEVITQITKMFGSGVVTYTADLGLADFCRTKESAFLQLAFHYRSRDGQAEALRRYFSQDEEYGDQLRRLDAAARTGGFRLYDRKNAERLFGRQLAVSPTQVENYYKCGFLFFCANGMKAYPRGKANLNPLSLGKVTHYVLEQLLSDSDFYRMEHGEIVQAVERLLDGYMDRFMGGRQDKTARFLRLYRNTARSLVELARNIQKEFAHCRFQPAAFELEIGDRGAVQPITLPLSDGCSVKLIGEIDRVDSYQKDGKTYIRVVDYKSGAGRTFDLSEIYYGLNLQMLLYLFSLWEQGEAKFGETVPAGVLYLPAGGAFGSFGVTKREGDAEDAAKEIQKGFRMNGLLLQDEEILSAMEQIEQGKQGVYLPVGLSKTPVGDSPYTTKSLEFLVTLDELNTLKSFAKGAVVRMCEQLFAGEVGAVPLEGYGGGHSACDYCAYASVCGHTPGQPARRVEHRDKQTLLEQIKEDDHA